MKDDDALKAAYLAQAMMTVSYAKTKQQKISDEYKASLVELYPNANFAHIDNIVPTHPIDAYKVAKLARDIESRLYHGC